MSVLVGGSAKLVSPEKPSLRATRRNAAAAAICCMESATRRSDLLLATVKIAVIPLAALAVSASGLDPAQAGVLSGYRGWDFELPRIDIPDSFKENAEKRRQKYEEFDAATKKSPFVQELLKKSKERAAKNRQQILDKYCERQAEWGVGDCSLEYSTQEEKEKFLELMRKKRADTEKIGEATPSVAQAEEEMTTKPSTE